MAFRLTNAAASAAANGTGLRSYIGSSPAIKFFTGGVPGDAESDPAGTELADITIGNFGAAANGVITSAGGNVAASDSGEVGCWALYQSDGTTKVGDGLASENSADDITFDEGTWVAGGTVSLGSFSITIPPH